VYLFENMPQGYVIDLETVVDKCNETTALETN
jgi:hypothetical protein